MRHHILICALAHFASAVHIRQSQGLSTPSQALYLVARLSGLVTPRAGTLIVAAIGAGASSGFGLCEPATSPLTTAAIDPISESMGMEFPETAEQADDSYREQLAVGLRECPSHREVAFFMPLPLMPWRKGEECAVDNIGLVSVNGRAGPGAILLIILAGARFDARAGRANSRAHSAICKRIIDGKSDTLVRFRTFSLQPPATPCNPPIRHWTTTRHGPSPMSPCHLS